jgi:hypothetical protein
MWQCCRRWRCATATLTGARIGALCAQPRLPVVSDARIVLSVAARLGGTLPLHVSRLSMAIGGREIAVISRAIRSLVLAIRTALKLLRLRGIGRAAVAGFGAGGAAAYCGATQPARKAAVPATIRMGLAVISCVFLRCWNRKRPATGSVH